MSRILVGLQAALLLAGAAAAQCSSLTTQTTAGNGQNGTTFDVVNLSATSPLVITNFDQCWFSAGTSDIAIYTKTGTSAGSELVSTAWTLVGTVTGVVHGVAPALDPIPLTLNLSIPPNSTQGFYITSTNGNTVAYTTGSNQYMTTIGSNADLQVKCGAGISYPFGSGFGLPTAGRIWNGRVNYCVGGTGTVFATATSVGTGCVNKYSSFYQTFTAGTFSLSNSSIAMMPTGNGYIVIPGSANWWTPVGSNLGLTDDSVSAALPLGFTLNYPGGSTTDVFASSNGFVWAQSSTVNGCCTGDPLGLLSGAARWCALWNDLNPGAGGTVVFDQDPVNGAAYLTYTGVYEYGTTNPNTFQVAFFNTGVVEMRWGSCTIANHQVLSGWSPGGNARDPLSTNLQTSLPITTSPDTLPLGLSASGRPIATSSINLVTTSITPTAPFGAILLGLTNPSLSLAGLGMPGCTQYSDGLATLLYLPLGASSVTTPFGVPGLVGLTVQAQSFLYDPAAGATPLGATSSNGVALLIGDY